MSLLPVRWGMQEDKTMTCITNTPTLTVKESFIYAQGYLPPDLAAVIYAQRQRQAMKDTARGIN